MNNPLISAGFVLLTVLLVAFTYRTASRMWASHVSADKLRKRQIADAERGALYYRALAEQYEAAAVGCETTLARLRPDQGLPLAPWYHSNSEGAA